MSRWLCQNCGEVVQSDGPLACGCPHCKTKWINGHAVWSVTPSREVQEREGEDAEALECAICGHFAAGHGQALGMVFQSVSCQPDPGATEP